MIQPKHLRLGNYLLNTCRECAIIVKVTLIDNQHIGCSLEGVRVDLCYKFDNYAPIPLTGKIISNFAGYQALKIGSNNEGFFYYTSNGQFVKLDYVHQLQNLYFAITGEELPVDLASITAEAELETTTV